MRASTSARTVGEHIVVRVAAPPSPGWTMRDLVTGKCLPSGHPPSEPAWDAFGHTVLIAFARLRELESAPRISGGKAGAKQCETVWRPASALGSCSMSGLRIGGSTAARMGSGPLRKGICPPFGTFASEQTKAVKKESRWVPYRQ